MKWAWLYSVRILRTAATINSPVRERKRINDTKKKIHRKIGRTTLPPLTLVAVSVVSLSLSLGGGGGGGVTGGGGGGGEAGVFSDVHRVSHCN